MTDSEDDDGNLRVSFTTESDGDSSDKESPKASLAPPSKKMKTDSEKSEIYTDFAQRMMVRSIRILMVNFNDIDETTVCS